jgi:signal transduction histidine kinase
MERVDPLDDVTTAIRALPLERPATTPLPKAPLGRLVCVVGRETGRTFALGPRTVVLGRGTDADVCLSGDDISRHHASISWERGGFILEDLKSINGTTVNGLPVQRHDLKVGDRIQIAESATLVFTRYDLLEQRALQLQKLETLGHLAGGLAHDFGNVVNVIAGTVEILEDAIRRHGHVEASELSDALATIRIASSNAGSIVERILCFSRSDASTTVARVELSPIVQEVAAMVQRSCSTGIEVRTDVEPQAAIRGDATALSQALMNLCVNARDAMPLGGRLAIGGRTVDLPRKQALEVHLASAGRYVALTVADSGTGMDETTKARIFEPFFTTKPAGAGTGLGLFSVFGIVRALGGAITVESSLGQGTEVTLLLPSA